MAERDSFAAADLDLDGIEELIELRPGREHQNMRLDRYVAGELPDLSRTYLQSLIDQELLLVDGQKRRPAFKMTPGQVVTIALPVEKELEPEPEDIPLGVIFENAEILVVNKPAGMVVHPAAGHPHGTLVNAVLHHAPGISIDGSNRPGIVHRLDKDTSGIMVVAKTAQAQAALTGQWLDRAVEKHYLALVAGVVEEDQATIEAPIDRDRYHRQRMAATRGGREAVTHFRVKERFAESTLLDVEIETGRTHQIRVHLAFIGFPVVGDAVYGNKFSARIAEELGVGRQWLHASSLTFDMPGSGERRTFTAPLPEDLEATLERLQSTKGEDDEPV